MTSGYPLSCHRIAATSGCACFTATNVLLLFVPSCHQMKITYTRIQAVVDGSRAIGMAIMLRLLCGLSPHIANLSVFLSWRVPL
jgi:hypothetical protein